MEVTSFKTTTHTQGVISHNFSMPTSNETRDSETAPCQTILEIRLSGISLFITIAALVIAINILQPTTTAALLTLAPLPFFISNDFRAFISLGPGGTPSTFFGYLKITYLRLFALSDPFQPPNFNPQLVCPSTGYFGQASLPYRKGPRPVIAGIAPQRQLNQFGCPTVHASLRAALTAAAIESPNLLRTGTSCFEKQGLALFARSENALVNMTCNGEICHVHASDKAMHLNLHPADAKMVLECGWGQRHPLARGGWLGRYVPREFVMVYAPRTAEEGVAVGKIIEAAAWWVMGRRIAIEVGKKN